MRRPPAPTVNVYWSCAPTVSMLPAPVDGTPLDTEAPTEIGNDCAAPTADSVNEYVPVFTPLPDTVNTYGPAAINVGPTSFMLCCANPYWYDPPADCNDHKQLQPPGAAVNAYRSWAPGDSRLPAPTAGTPFDTEAFTEIANDCGLGTAHTLNAYGPGAPSVTVSV